MIKFKINKELKLILLPELLLSKQI